MDIYVQKNGRLVGPFAEARLRMGVEDGEFSPNDLAQMLGTNSWQPLVNLIHLEGIYSPPPIQEPPSPSSDNPDQDSHTGPEPEAGQSVSTEKVAFASDPHPDDGKQADNPIPDPPPIPPAPPSNPSTAPAGNPAKVFASISLAFSLLALLIILGEGESWFPCALLGVVIGHFTRWYIRSVAPGKSGGGLALAALIIGYVSMAHLFENKGHKPSTTSSVGQASATAQPRIEQVLGAEIQKDLNQNKQKLFTNIHPVGTAKSVTLHDVTVTAWKRGQDTNRFEDVQQFTVRFTLYWEGPITKDGYTKIASTYDVESQRYTSGQILATNGMTNQDAGNAALGLFGTWLQYEAEKEGAEKATRDYYNGR
jgi:hypothetical protein